MSTTPTTDTLDILALKLQKVIAKHPEPRNSIHEAYGLIAEEYHELEMEIFKRNPDYSAIIDESFDVMVTLVRLIDFCNTKISK